MHPSGTAAELDGHSVVLRDVSHAYGSTPVLNSVNLAIRKGEFFGILGASGSGKTTILRALGGFVFVSRGEIYIDGQLMGRTPPFRRNTTMVFQHLALFPHLSVADNLAYGLRVRRRPKALIDQKVRASLDMIRLPGLGDRRPSQLSGGQQQRVALARALILEPSVVLFDEPLGALDLKLRLEMQVELKNIHRQSGTTFVYVTHDQQEALSLCDRIALIERGRIVQVGTAEEVYERPGTRFAASFIGDINFLPGTVVGREPQGAAIRCEDFTVTVEVPSTVRDGDRVDVCIRPERINVGEHAATCDVRQAARVVDVIYTGATRRCILGFGSGARLNVDVDARLASALTIGEEVAVGWNGRDAFVLAG